MSRNILAVIIGIVFSIIFLELTIKFCAIMGIGPIGEEIIAWEAAKRHMKTKEVHGQWDAYRI